MCQRSENIMAHTVTKCTL